MNGLIFLVELVCFFGGLLIIKKVLGKEGIYAWIAVATCLAELQVTKTITVFSYEVSLGNVLFASTFFATDILYECYGEKESKKGPLFSLLGALCYIAFAIITPLFVNGPSSIEAQASFRCLLSLSVRITISSIVMLFIANLLDVFLYAKIAAKTNGKHMWLRTNVATILCNCGENYFFTFFALYNFKAFSFLGGYFSLKEVFIAASIGSVIEILLSFLDTPLLYLSKYLDKK